MESTVFVLDDGEDIPLKELNLTFIHDFEYFLRTEKKCRTDTVWGYMIVLKHIVSIARNDGRLPFNPFAGYINSPESPLPSGSKSNSTSCGRTYADPCSRKGKAGE